MATVITSIGDAQKGGNSARVPLPVGPGRETRPDAGQRPRYRDDQRRSERNHRRAERSGAHPKDVDFGRVAADTPALGGADSPALSSLHRCSLMRRELEEVERVDLEYSRSRGRKRRMARGLERWHRSTTRSYRMEEASAAARKHHARWQSASRRAANPLGPPPGDGAAELVAPHLWWPVALVLLTGQPDVESAFGAVRSFWMDLRDHYGPITYCWWLELTREGMPHVHAMIVNPPEDFWTPAARVRLESAWGQRFVKVQGRPLKWFRGKGVGYALQYAKKIGDKAYQQEYDDLPREIRTFGTSLKDHSANELEGHENRVEARYVAEAYNRETRDLDPSHLVVHAHVDHVGSPCTLRYVTKSEAIRQRQTRVAKRLASSARARACPGVSSNKADGRSRRTATASVNVSSPVGEILLNVQLSEGRFTGLTTPATLISEDPQAYRNPRVASTLAGPDSGVTTKEAAVWPPSLPA